MDFRSLQSRIEGEVVAAGPAAVREMLWNGLQPDRRPTAIVRVANEADVIAAVRFAREQGVRMAIRGGGHSWCGAPLRNGSLLLDLRRLNTVVVDAPNRRAVVQPVINGRDLCRALAPHALAFPVGHCSTVALSGFVLSGGLGWNMGTWGPACFSVEAVDVVAAAGELVHASADQHADLLWAARGAGPGFFGVVTKFHLKLDPVPKRITTSTYVYPIDCVPTLAKWMAETATTMAPEVERVMTLAGSAHGPTGEPVCILIATAFVDDEAAARRALSPMASCPLRTACLAETLNQPTSFDALFDAMDRLFPAEHRYCVESYWSNESAARFLAPIEDIFARGPSQALLLCIAAAPSTTPMADAAFSLTAPTFALSYAVWEDPADDRPNIAWHEEIVAALTPTTIGHYIGESNIAGRPGRAAHGFMPANWARLEALRRQWDPDGVFHGYFE